MLVSAGLVFLCGPTNWATEARFEPGELSVSSQTGAPGRNAEQPRLMEAAFREPAGPPATKRPVHTHRTEAQRLEPTGSAAPIVQVRAGDHGDFERVVFEWPEAIDHHVVQRAEQVTVAFGRPGRIDLSQIRDRLGQRVVDAWAEDGEVARRVVLRLSPGARIHSFSLQDGRIVVIDVSGGSTTASLAASAPAPEQAASAPAPEQAASAPAPEQAASAPAPERVASAPAPEPDAIQELRRALEQRDAVIESLLARVERLERSVALSSGDLDRVAAGGAGAAPSAGNTPPPQSGSQPVGAPRPPSSELVAGPSDAPSVPAGPGQRSGDQAQSPAGTAAEAEPSEPEREDTAQAQAPAPGQFEVDEEAVERALDFTLVQEGSLLLPAGRAEITPSFTYTRRTGDFPFFVNADPPFVGEQEVRRNEFEFFASLLVGLPFDSQLELGLPYNLVDQSVVNRVGGNEFNESSRTGGGLGDFSVGLAKTVLRERGWWPDVVLRANWDTGTGERDDNDVALDGGFQAVTGSISLAKRQDPLVFVAGASYEAAFEKDDIDPGDTLGFSIGAFLAASPNTSLRAVLNQSFIDEFKVDGRSINGSDRVQSILTLGASAILGRNVLLDGAVGVGLTDESPDYSVSISLPIRFNTPAL